MIAGSTKTLAKPDKAKSFRNMLCRRLPQMVDDKLMLIRMRVAMGLKY